MAAFQGGLTSAGLRAYAVARVARVYPLYLFVLLWTAAPAFLEGKPAPGFWEHALALQAWDPSLEVAYGYNSPGWSLSVEFFLYACFPLLLLALRRVDRSVKTLLVAAGVVVVSMGVLTLWFSLGPSHALPWADPDSAHRWLYRSPAPRLGDFALGMLAARLYPRLAATPGSVRGGLALAGGGAVAIAALMAWPRHLYSPSSFDLSYALPAVALILGLALAGHSGPLRWLTRPSLVRLGEASYALYLIQMPVLEWAGALMAAVATPAGYGFATALVLVMLCAVSLGLHHAVERPMQRVLRSRLG